MSDEQKTALATTGRQDKALAIWASQTTQEKIRALIPKSMDWDRFARLTTSLINRNPKLAECDSVSFFAALSDCATIGVYPDPVTGKAYLIPRRRKDGSLEATLLVGYKGLRDIALRSPAIADLWTGVVRTGDVIRLVRAPRMELVHEQDPACDGEVLGFYSCARLADGGCSWEWMANAEVETVRNQVLAGIREEWKREQSPWVTSREEMGRKTVMRRHFKSLPIRSEDMEVLQREMDDDIGGMKRAEEATDEGAGSGAASQRPAVPMPMKGAASQRPAVPMPMKGAAALAATAQPPPKPAEMTAELPLQGDGAAAKAEKPKRTRTPRAAKPAAAERDEGESEGGEGQEVVDAQAEVVDEAPSAPAGEEPTHEPEPEPEAEPELPPELRPKRMLAVTVIEVKEVKTSSPTNPVIQKTMVQGKVFSGAVYAEKRHWPVLAKGANVLIDIETQWTTSEPKKPFWWVTAAAADEF